MTQGTAFVLTGFGTLLLSATEVEAAAIPGSETPAFRANALRLVSDLYQSNPDYRKIIEAMPLLSPGALSLEVCFNSTPAWGRYGMGNLSQIYMCAQRDPDGRTWARFRLIDNQGRTATFRVPNR